MFQLCYNIGAKKITEPYKESLFELIFGIKALIYYWIVTEVKL